MPSTVFAGLVKFFRDERHLDELIGGLLYCNTPEHYRMSAAEGIGDQHEACMRSYRQSRGDGAMRVTIDGEEIDEITAVTVHRGGKSDMWLHCWCALHVPDDDGGIISLVEDLNRLRREFGTSYAFIPRDRLASFAAAIQSLTDNELLYGLVDYSENEERRSIGCKSTTFAYQREYRFAIGQCSHLSREPLELRSAAGFSSYIKKNSVIRAMDSANGTVLG